MDGVKQTLLALNEAARVNEGGYKMPSSDVPANIQAIIRKLFPSRQWEAEALQHGIAIIIPLKNHLQIGFGLPTLAKEGVTLDIYKDEIWLTFGMNMLPYLKKKKAMA